MPISYLVLTQISSIGIKHFNHRKIVSWFLLNLTVVAPIGREEWSSYLHVRLSADALTAKRRQSMTIPLVLYSVGDCCTPSDGREMSAVFQFAKKYWDESRRGKNRT